MSDAKVDQEVPLTLNPPNQPNHKSNSHTSSDTNTESTLSLDTSPTGQAARARANTVESDVIGDVIDDTGTWGDVDSPSSITSTSSSPSSSSSSYSENSLSLERRSMKVKSIPSISSFGHPKRRPSARIMTVGPPDTPIPEEVKPFADTRRLSVDQYERDDDDDDE